MSLLWRHLGKVKTTHGKHTCQLQLAMAIWGAEERKGNVLGRTLVTIKYLFSMRLTFWKRRQIINILVNKYVMY